MFSVAYVPLGVRQAFFSDCLVSENLTTQKTYGHLLAAACQACLHSVQLTNSILATFEDRDSLLYVLLHVLWTYFAFFLQATFALDSG